MNQLSELAQRCERGAASDLELDALIAHEVHGSTGHDVDFYTASMDAAMTLRPTGWSWQLKTAEHHENGFQFECWVSWGPAAYRRTTAQAATEARAVSAGWLRARSLDAGQT